MKNIIPEIYVINCKEALEFYKEAFGGEIKNVQTGAGKPMFKDFEDKIIHSELHINDYCTLYFVDMFEEIPKGKDIHIVLEFDSEEEITKAYYALSKGGNVKFELQKTFWGALHAVVTDCHGNTWGLNYTVQ
ncbi:MAG: glyoxalase/bleomycin resistance/extradiol dioxygenase family protein [Bacillota bacterium]|nr:glyoxalase/bleomycin resistance/extradiol dioxygenase family protein [Bacillota bacterium]